MPGAPSGPAFFSTSASVALTSSASSSMRAARSSSDSNTTARASVSNSRASAAERLRMAPPGASEPKSATIPPTDWKGSATLRITEGLPSHGQALQVKLRLKLAQHDAETTGREQVFHVVLARGLEVDQDRRL